MNNIKTCCKDCSERVLGCHSNCDKYDRFKKWVDNCNARVKAGWAYIPQKPPRKKTPLKRT